MIRDITNTCSFQAVNGDRLFFFFDGRGPSDTCAIIDYGRERRGLLAAKEQCWERAGESS
jgi:hypothetical protein